MPPPGRGRQTVAGDLARMPTSMHRSCDRDAAFSCRAGNNQRWSDAVWLDGLIQPPASARNDLLPPVLQHPAFPEVGECERIIRRRASLRQQEEKRLKRRDAEVGALFLSLSFDGDAQTRKTACLERSGSLQS